MNLNATITCEAWGWSAFKVQDPSSSCISTSPTLLHPSLSTLRGAHQCASGLQKGIVTKNRCVTHVKIRGYANFVSSLLAYLISAVASWFCNSILSRSRMLLQIVCYCNVTLFSIARKF